MKNTLRVLATAIAVMLCLGALVACSDGEVEATQNTTEPVVTILPTETTAGTEPFVAPADALGKIVSADQSLITWNVYPTTEDTIDFMGVNVKELGKADAEMTLIYLERDVTYYKIVEGKLNSATYEDILPGCIVGVTTLEEGVQEVYIIFTPAEDDGSGDYIETTDEFIEETIATTVAPTEEVTPDEGNEATEPTEEPTEDTAYTEPPLEEPSVDEEP